MEPEHERRRESDRDSGRLVEAVRQVRIAAAEKSDVVVEMREADSTRLDMLVQELEPIIKDVPVDDDRFDFAVSSGLQPRFWIDATAHVVMGPDRRTYRFVRDTRLGRVVLGESADRKLIAERVTAYVAERIHERELVFAGEVYSVREQMAADETGTTATGGGESSVKKRSMALSYLRRKVEEEALRKTRQGFDPSTGTRQPAALEKSDRRAAGRMYPLAWILLGLLIGAAALAWFFRDFLIQI